MAKVSIIIPTYNCLVFLPTAIDSVLTQTHQDFELLVINDNSTDGTASYLNTLIDERIITITTNGVGASLARNLGIAKASGEFIAFLDADDFWLPEKLSMQLALHADSPNLAMSFTNYDHLTETYESIIDCFGYWEQFKGQDEKFITLKNPLDFIIKNNIIGTSTVMVKTEILTQMHRFNEDLKYGEDWELWLRICESHDVGVLNSIQTGYLMRQDSTTQTDGLRLRNLRCIELILNRYQKDKQYWNLSSSALNNARARILEGYADYHRGLCQYRSAITYGIYSLFLAPQKRRVRSLLGDCKSMLLPA
ncbi:glycosyltransferase family 2 protein [Aliivibrio sifiae]|uniref:Glycosyl transferase n=1 Tax=Aliivibrio sifiae TaxID=566293 RepID=A0A2S7XCZ1_9GAMM|nr:glycosyltransferase family A protein [Aliivibrio sifiae]PQJ89229.1 glycosyl transferase [Aliivibrio sifiae]